MKVSAKRSQHPRSKTKILYEGKHLRVLCRDGWEFVERTKANSAVVIVAIAQKDELIVVEQYRQPMDSQVIELPAGLVGDIDEASDETVETAALRELFEETGYAATSVEILSSGPPSAGLSSETVTFVVASGLNKTGKGGGECREKITVHLVPLRNVRAWLAKKRSQGTCVDPKIYAGLFWVARETRFSTTGATVL